MKRTPVQSSNIKSIGYEEKSKVLEIEFHSGGVYQYFSVPHEVYEGLINASSHGKYFHAHIKTIYSYKRIR